jgi:hypothetical protein
MATSKSGEDIKPNEAKIAVDISQIELLRRQVISGVPLEEAFIRLDMKLDPDRYFREVIEIRNPGILPILSKDEADRMDILTQQSLSAYAKNIEPLLIAKSSAN